MFKARKLGQPAYLSNLICEYQLTRNLHSAAADLLHQSRVTTTFLFHSFSVVALAVEQTVYEHWIIQYVQNFEIQAYNQAVTTPRTSQYQHSASYSVDIVTMAALYQIVFRSDQISLDGLSSSCCCHDADLSRNRFTEVPVDICNCGSVERLNCYHNVIKSLPDAMIQLQNLVYLNLRLPTVVW